LWNRNVEIVQHQPTAVLQRRRVLRADELLAQKTNPLQVVLGVFPSVCTLLDLLNHGQRQDAERNQALLAVDDLAIRPHARGLEYQRPQIVIALRRRAMNFQDVGP
jgi:hypothetical protein